MAFDSFLKIDGIDGESTDVKHKGEIEVLSFNWNITRSRRGRAKVADFTIVKHLDKATPQLFDSVCAGDRIPEATLTARKAGEGQRDFLIVTLKEVFVNSVAPAGNTSNDMPLEQVSLSFSRSEITFIPQDKTGKPGPPVTSSCSLRSDSSAPDREP